MTHQTFNNRRIIWESKTKEILSILGCFSFVAVDIWTKGRTSSFTFWGGVALFGGGGLYVLIRLLNPNNLFVKHSSPLAKQILAEQFQKAKKDLGCFTFDEEGFTLAENKSTKYYRWVDIEAIFAFKEDQVTTDEICMDVFTNDSSLIRLTEGTPGWYQFNIKLSENIPAIPFNWNINIAVPAFEIKLTLLFDRKGRTPQEAEAACYAE